MKTIDVQFPRNPTYGGKANDFAGQHYAYLITNEQAAAIEAGAEYAVVQAPGDNGPMQVVKIVGEPSETPQKATRSIIAVIDLTAYRETLQKVKEAKKIRAEIDRLAKEAAERARIEALAAGSPEIKELMDRLTALGV